MTQAQRPTGGRTPDDETKSRTGTAGETPHTPLPALKRELVAARERGEKGTLAALLRAYPAEADALVAFDAALVATSAYANVVPTAETQALAERAAARAFAAAFPGVASVAEVAPVAAAAVTARSALAAGSLKALRQGRGLSLKGMATRLGLGVDVLSTLEAGRIRVASLPERLVAMLGEALDATAEQVAMALRGPAISPALLRSRVGATKNAPQPVELDFAEVVRTSPEMSADEKARWLAE